MVLILLLALEGAARNLHVVVGQEARPVRLQRLGHLLQHLDSRCLRASDPAIKEQGRESIPGCFQNCLKSSFM